MNSRERVLKAINHEIPDRVPIDLGGTKSSGIHVDEYIQLGKALGIDIEMPKVYDQFQMLARVDFPIRSRFNTDVVLLENICENWDVNNVDWKVWETGNSQKVLVPDDFKPEKGDDGYYYLRNKKGTVVAYMPEGGLYFERYIDSNYSSGDDMMPPEKWKASIELYTDEELKVLQKRAKLLHDYTDYAIIGNYSKLKFMTAAILAGHTLTEWLCRLITDPDYAYEILSATAERNIENLELYLQAVGDYIDIIFVSTTDYGTQKAEMFNPEIFKEIYRPNLKKVNDYIHKNSKVKTMYHSCGSISNIIGYMAEAGIDIINPVQTTADNMDPVELKSKYGKDIVFWGGGVDTQTTLQFGSKEDVEEQVRERLKIFGEGGGFVFCPVHNIQYGVPIENIIAAYDTAFKYGVYK